MRIDVLRLQNFRGFVDREFRLHPQFNLVVGENGAGKTSLLEGLAVVMGSWMSGLGGGSDRRIRNEDVRLRYLKESQSWERQLSCSVKATGTVGAQLFESERSIEPQLGFHDNEKLLTIAASLRSQMSAGENIILPVMAYYGTRRSSNYQRDAGEAQIFNSLADKSATSRISGYSQNPGGLSPDDFRAWLVRQTLIALQEGVPRTQLVYAVREALLTCIPGAEDIFFDARINEVAVKFSDGEYRTFDVLSDGQRGVLALVGDLAHRMAQLNPQLSADVSRLTPGLVLIDELDLHLHPRWQRLIIEQLRDCFPNVQFVCSTHSPFLIQSLRSGDELINLDGQSVSSLADLPLDDIIRGIQGVSKPEVSVRYEEMRQVAKSYLERLDSSSQTPKEKLENMKTQLAEDIAPYADNPAFQAFLEMKRVATLGS